MTLNLRTCAVRMLCTCRCCFRNPEPSLFNGPQKPKLLIQFPLHCPRFLSPAQCTAFGGSVPRAGETGQDPAPGASGSLPPTPFTVQSVWPSPPRAGLDSCATSLAWVVILSAEALAQRRARQAAEQLSQEQKALVQMLLGAHSRHLGSMFHQFVLFKVRLRGLGLERGHRVPGGWSEGRVAALEMRLDGPQEPGPRPRASLGSGPTAPPAPVPPAAALARPGPCAAAAHALRRHQHVHGAASGQVHQGPARLPLCGLPLPFRKKTLQEIIIPPPPSNKVTQQTSLSLGLSQAQAWSLAVPSQGSCRPLGSSGLTPASAGPCPWRTRSPSSRGPL